MTKTAELIEKDFYVDGGEPLPEKADDADRKREGQAQEAVHRLRRRPRARRRRLSGLRGPARRIRHHRQCLCRRRHRPGDAARRRPCRAGAGQRRASRSRRGEPLVVLDETDARLALAEAEAAYDQARRRVAGYVATDRQLAAQISMRGAEASRAAADVQSAASADVERARLDYSRRDGAGRNRRDLRRGADPTARNAFEQAAGRLCPRRGPRRRRPRPRSAAASGQRDANQALIAGASVDDNPEVARRPRRGSRRRGSISSARHPRAGRRHRLAPPGPGRPAASSRARC